jgi:hypothetical protein
VLLGLWRVGGATKVGGFLAVSNFRLRSLSNRMANSFERQQAVALWLIVVAFPQLALRLILYVH